MSARGMSASVLTEIAKQNVRSFRLVEFYWDSGTSYGTTWTSDRLWNGNTYLSLGNLISISDIEEDVNLYVGDVTITLSGVSQANIAEALTENYTDRRVVIRRGFLNSSETIIVDPIIIFDGRLNTFKVSENIESGSSVLAWSATSHWADFDRTSGRRTNKSDQQRHFPGDTGLDFVATRTRDIIWGRK